MSGAIRIVIGVAAILTAFPSGGITLTAFSIAGTAIAPSVFALGFGLLLSSAQSLLTGRQRLPQQTVEGNVRGSSETHLIVMGERRVGGKLFNGGTSGSTGQDWTVLIAHSVCHAGGCEGITGAYFDDRYVALAQLGALDGSTNVTATDLNGLVNIAFYRGTDSQLADAAAVAAGIEISTDRARRVCYSRVRYTRPSSDATFQRAFPAGLGTQFNPVLRGWRCYDPRLDSTNGGSGPQRLNDPTTWAWTQNPIICAATYLIAPRLDGGAGVPTTRFLWSDIAAAANVCDELISTPVGMIARYRCDIVLDTRNRFEDNLNLIMETCAGVGILSGVYVQLIPAAYRNPTETIDANWLRGSPVPRPVMPIDTLPNTIIAGYFDAGPASSGGSNWKQIDTPPFSISALVASDGTREPALVAYEGVTHPYRAQYLNHVNLKLARRQATLDLPCNLRGLLVRAMSTVTVDLPEYGINSRVYQVTGFRWDGGLPLLSLKEHNAADYAPEAFVVPTTSGTVTTTPETVGQPQLVTAVGITDGVALSWQSPASNMVQDPLIAVYVVQRSPTGAGVWSELTRALIFSYVDNTAIAGTTYDYRILAANRQGQTGPASAIVSATPGSVGGSVSSGVLNPGYELGDRDWTKGSGWTIERSNARPGGSWSGRHTGAASQIINNGVIFCEQGDVLTASGGARFDSSIGSASAAIQILFYNASGSLLSTVSGNTIVQSFGGTSYTVTRVASAPAPANAAFARVAFTATGTCNVDEVSYTAPPRVLGEIPDGGGFAKINASQVIGGNHGITVAGSGIRAGDNRNLPPVRITGVGSRWNGTVRYAFSAASPAVVTFTADAQVLFGGDWNSTFSAASTTTTQARGSSQLYYLYYDAATVYAGGSLTLFFTTDALDLVRGDNRIHIGTVTVTVPASGSGGLAGKPGGGGVIP